MGRGKKASDAAPRRGASAAAAAAGGAEPDAAAGEAVPAPEPSPAAKKRAGAKRKATPAEPQLEAAAQAAEAAPTPEPAAKKKTASKGRGKAASKVAAAEAEGVGESGSEVDSAAIKKPAKRSRAAPSKAAGAKQQEAAKKPEQQEKDEEGENEVPAPKGPRRKKDLGPERVRYSEAMRPPPPAEPVFKILSWNVAGLRGVMNKNNHFFPQLLQRESPDVVCLQETKCSDKHLAELVAKLGLPEGWHASWSCSQTKAGYSGVATFSRVAPLETRVGMERPEHDGEGRLLISEFKSFYLLNVYVPNSGEGLRRLDYRIQEGGWDDSLAKLVNKLQQTKPVVVAGDLNCAHKEIDIHNPKTNLKSAGFTPEERASFSSRLLGPTAAGGCGLVDTWRQQFPEIVGYTYYSHRFNCRAKGIGWRLDYMLVSPALMPRVHDSWMLQDWMGSDHVPLGLTLRGALDE